MTAVSLAFPQATAMGDTLDDLPDGAVIELRWCPRGSEPPAGFQVDDGMLCHHDFWSFAAWRVVSP